MSKTENANITMEQYIGKKKGVEIFGDIIGILLAVSVLASIIFTIIALVGGGANAQNDMWDVAIICYYLIFMLGIVYLFFVFSGRFKRRKEYKKSIKKLTERNLLELARQEFAPAKNKKQVVIITDHFLYFKSQGIVLPLEDIAWAYMQLIYMSRGGGQGQPYNYRPWIYDKFGNEYTFVSLYDEKNYGDMSYIINYTKKLNPSIMLGFTEENKQRYQQLYKKKN